MYHHETKAVCRGCGLELKGEAYHRGGSASHPVTGKRCLTNHFGGYVCSEQCDRKVHLGLEESMPGHAGQRSLDRRTSQQIAEKWANYA